MSYADLTEVEKAHLDEYRNIRKCSTMAGFSKRQQKRKDEIRDWIEQRRKDIGRAMLSDPTNNKRLNRKGRLASLSEAEIRRGDSKRETDLPSAHCTPTEKALIEEREFYFAVKATTAAQKARKAQNRRELAAIRKKLWSLLQDKKEDHESKRLHRDDRWCHICVATKKGSPYFNWKHHHDVETGDEKRAADKSSVKVKGSRTRRAIIQWHHDHQGITEQPPGSNCDNRKDGIRHAQIMCADGGTWLLYSPWCGTWNHEGLRVAGIECGSFIASVSLTEDYARKSLGPFKRYTSGFTTTAKPGDVVILFGRGIHEATVEEVTSTGYWTREGNTSPGDGSQANGGWSGPRFRSAAEVHGVCHLATA